MTANLGRRSVGRNIVFEYAERVKEVPCDCTRNKKNINLRLESAMDSERNRKEGTSNLYFSNLCVAAIYMRSQLLERHREIVNIDLPVPIVI